MATTSTDLRLVGIDEAELDRIVEQDPHDPGRHNARLTDHGHHVWAVIDYLKSRNGDIAATAAAFTEGSTDAVHAAMRYYVRHRELIDAKILLEHESSQA